jgi:alpha-galactosidase
MNKGIKISIIGAGSGQFSMGIVRDLCLTPGLWGSMVSFMDINPDRLNAIYNVATRYTTELKADIRFEKTLDRRASLKGADFVINCAMVGGWDQFSQTARLCYQNGYPQAVFIDSYYQYKLFLDIIRDMEDVCPQAWYIQSANPVFEGCTLLARQSKIKIVGLCHGYQGVLYVARVLGLDPDKVHAQSYGVNHCIWLKKFYYEGKDAYPILLDWVQKKSTQFFDSPECSPSDEMGPKVVDIFKRVGMFPIGDTATPGGDSYFRWYHLDRATELKWKEDPNTWNESHIQHINAAVVAFSRLAGDPTARATDLFPPDKTSETNVSIIDSIVNDKPGIFQVNIPNKGCIPGIADDVVVEVPGMVSGSGIQGLQMVPLPKPVMFHLYDKINLMERDLEAFLSHDRGLLMEFILANPWTRSIEQAQAVMDTVFSHPAYQEMAAYYK